MTIDVVFDPPLPSDSREAFNLKAFDTVAKLNSWAAEANQTAQDINDDKVAAEQAKDDAEAAQQAAEDARDLAQSSATTAASAKNDAVAAKNLAEAAKEAAEDAAEAAQIWNPSEYVAKAGSTMTGPLEVPAGARGTQVPRAQETLLRFGASDPLPTSDIGPIWHDGYVSIMVWQEIGAFEGYASVNVGQLIHYDGDEPPPGYISSLADITDPMFAALAAKTGRTSTLDARGVVIRGLDEGRDLDTGRTRGSYQADGIRQSSFQIRRIGNIGSSTPAVTDATGDASIQNNVGTGGINFGFISGTDQRDRVSIGSVPETRMKNLALPTAWKY